MAKSKASGGSRTSSTASLQDPSIRARIVSAIKEIWSRYSIEKKIVKDAAKRKVYKTNKDGSRSKAYNVYWACAACGDVVDKVDIDHIKPTGQYPNWPPDMAFSWDAWLKAQFSHETNLQALCKPCHQDKSANEKRTGVYKK